MASIQPYENQLSELFCVASVCVEESYKGDVEVEAKRSEMHRCMRCWKHTASVEDGLCVRCEPIVDTFERPAVAQSA
jgi:hypothetical protein